MCNHSPSPVPAPDATHRPFSPIDLPVITDALRGIEKDLALIEVFNDFPADRQWSIREMLRSTHSDVRNLRATLGDTRPLVDEARDEVAAQNILSNQGGKPAEPAPRGYEALHALVDQERRTVLAKIRRAVTR